MNNIIKSAVKWIIFLLPAVLLLAPSGMFFPFITGKNFLFRIGVELAFCLYLALALVDKSYRPKWSPLTIAFGLFTLVIFIADIFAVSSASAFWSNFERMEGFVTLAHLFILYITASTVFKTKEDWDKWLLSTTAVSIFMMLFCFLQLSGEAVINQGGVRVDGLLGNAAYLAAYLLFHVFFLIALLLRRGLRVRGIADIFAISTGVYVIYHLLRLVPKPSGSLGLWSLIDHHALTTPGLILLIVAVALFVLALVSRVSQKAVKYERYYAGFFYGIAILSSLFLVYSTATRGAILGLIGGLFLAALTLGWKERENVYVKRGAIGLIGFVVLLTIAFFAFKNTSFIQNDPILSRFASISWHDKSQAREYVWPMAISGFKEKPILGWGQEGFIYVFEKYYTPEMYSQEPWFDRAHNSYLDWLVAGGVLGFLGYISLYGAALYLLYRSSFTFRVKAVLLGLLAAHAFQSLFIFDNLSSYLLFTMLLAMIGAEYKAKTEHVRKEGEEAGAPILISSLVVFAIMAFLVNWNGYHQNITLIKALSSGSSGAGTVLTKFRQALDYHSFGTAEARTQLSVATTQVLAAPQVSEANKVAFATTTIAEFEAQIKETPKDARPYIQLGTFLSSVSDHDNAIRLLEEARALSPKKQPILLALAEAYMRKGIAIEDAASTAKGLSIAKEAYDLAPAFDGMKLAYTQLLLAAHKPDEALKIAAGMVNTGALVNENLITGFIEQGHINDAKELMRREIARDPENANAYILLANIYLYAKDKRSAIQVFRDLITAAPKYKEAAEKDIAEIEKM